MKISFSPVIDPDLQFNDQNMRKHREDNIDLE